MFSTARFKLVCERDYASRVHEFCPGTGFPAGPFLGGRLPPKKNQLLPPKILLTLFLFTLSPLPLGYSPPKSFNSPPKGEILQETLGTVFSIKIEGAKTSVSIKNRSGTLSPLRKSQSLEEAVEEAVEQGPPGNGSQM